MGVGKQPESYGLLIFYFPASILVFDYLA